MKYLKHIKNFNENNIFPDDIICEIHDDDRIINSDDEDIIPRDVSNEGNVSFKPNGLWYSLGTKWLDWCKSNSPHWVKKNLFELELNDYNVLILGRDMSEKDFENKYGHSQYNKKDRKGNVIIDCIDWERVSEDYYGIEIKNPWGPIWSWIRPWDVSSGCIWNTNAIESITNIY